VSASELKSIIWLNRILMMLLWAVCIIGYSPGKLKVRDNLQTAGERIR
jgi:hypothetical protein